MKINPYLVQPSNAYGALTTAWIAATGETDSTILGALNTLETDLTTYGLTAKTRALYPIVGGTSTKHSYNFMDTATYQITWGGGVTHSSTGFTPNGVNGYGNTNFNPSTNGLLNSAHMSFYSRTNISASQIEMGSSDLPTGNRSLLASSIGGTAYYTVNAGAAYMTHANTDSRGFYMVNRSGATTQKALKNGSIQLTGAQTAVTNIAKYWLGAWNNENAPVFYWSTKELAFASIGDGLTDTEAANFYTAVQAFQTTLSRQV